jgi:hypothetical protein
MRRVLLAVAAAVSFSVPASVALVGTSSPAFASSSLTCMKLSGNFNSSITIKKCSVPPADTKTYKSASVVVSTLASGGTFTWSKSGATTTLGPAIITSPGRGRCSGYDTEQDITATVTGGTSEVTNADDTFAADVCVYNPRGNNPGGMTKLVTGTTVSI